MIANFLFQYRLIQPGGLTLVLILGSLALQAPVLSQEKGGALEHFLSMPESKWKDRPCYGPYQAAIPKYQRAFEEAETDYAKGIAIANLAIIAQDLAKGRRTRSAARDLCELWVMPNLDTSLAIELTNSCCWRRNVMRCATVYQRLKDPEKERACLAMLYEGNQREGDRDLAAYLLAYQYARSGKHQLAITIIRCLDADSKYARNRDLLISSWQKRSEEQKGQHGLSKKPKAKQKARKKAQTK